MDAIFAQTCFKPGKRGQNGCIPQPIGLTCAQMPVSEGSQ